MFYFFILLQGLTQGDILLEVNGYNFQNISHSRAVEIIKSQHNLHLTVTKARPQNLTGKICSDDLFNEKVRCDLAVKHFTSSSLILRSGSASIA